MVDMQKEREIETDKRKKLNEIFSFVKQLRVDNKLKLSEKEFNKEIILYFNITDFRVVASKTKLMTTLDLIEVKSLEWGEREIWISEQP